MRVLVANSGSMNFVEGNDPAYMKYYIKNGEMFLILEGEFINADGQITPNAEKFMDFDGLLYGGKTYNSPLGDIVFLPRYAYFYGGVRKELGNIPVPQDGVEVFNLPSDQYQNYPFTNPIDAAHGYFFRYSDTCGDDVGTCPGSYCVTNYDGGTRFHCSESLYPTGRQGPVGPRGATGIRGDEGKMGLQGEAGYKGAQGENNSSWDPVFLGLFLLLAIFIVVGIFFLRPVLGYPEFYFFRQEEGSPLF